jgi:hypothetical protein
MGWRHRFGVSLVGRFQFGIGATGGTGEAVAHCHQSAALDGVDQEETLFDINYSALGIAPGGMFPLGGGRKEGCYKMLARGEHLKVGFTEHYTVVPPPATHMTRAFKKWMAGQPSARPPE